MDHAQNTENSYIIDIERSEEKARLALQNRLLSKGMGGLWPRDKVPGLLSSVQSVLDVACGPGVWALDLAYNYPQLQVTGVDLSSSMIEWARAQAQTRNIENISFLIQNIRSLDFPEQSFDLINARLLIAALKKEEWLPFLQHCEKLLRPGGILCWTEGDNPTTNSQAYEELNYLLAQALWLSGQSLSVDGRHMGLLPYMPRLVQQAGFEDIELRSYVFDGSYNTEGWRVSAQDTRATTELLKNFLIQTKVVSEETFTTLFKQLEYEIQNPGYVAMGHVVSVWACKPS